MSLFDLAKLCTKSQDEKIAGNGRLGLSELKKVGFSLILHSTPSLQDILSALLEQIEANEILSVKDEFIPTHNVPQLGRSKAQQKYFEKNLLDKLYEYTQVECWALTARATTVVFDLPEDEVTGASLRENSKNKK